MEENIRLKIENRVQKILYSVFEYGAKTKMNSQARVTYIACPYCGDSKKNPNKKRFTIYWEDPHCYCYNCNTWKSISSFLKDYEEELSVKEISWISSRTINKIFSNKKSDTLFENQENYKNLLEYAIPIDELCLVMGCIRATKNNPYLKSRYLDKFSDNFLEYYPRIGDYKDNIIILNKIQKNKVIGITIRDNRPTAKAKYYNYSLSKIYQKFFPSRYNKLLNDNVDLTKYDTISNYYGFFELDFEKPITVFEGQIDRLFYPNSVAISSIWKNYDFFKNLENARFFFDDDKIGRSHNVKLLKQKHFVFLWSQYKNDFKPLKTHKIKDLSDIISFSFKNKIPYFKYCEKYFSNNPLNLMKI